MNIAIKKSITITGLMLFYLVSLNYNNTYMHENVHKQNAIYHGCKDYEIDINVFTDSSFRCLNNTYTKEQRRDVYNLDTINEIVSYNLQTLSYTIFACTTMIIVAMVLFMKGGKDGI